MKLNHKTRQSLNQAGSKLEVEEREIDSVLCWFSHDEQCFIPYTPEELTAELLHTRKAICSL